MSKNVPVAPSARYVITKPRGCDPSVSSWKLVRPSPSGSPPAPLSPAPEFGSRPKRVSQSFGSASLSVSFGFTPGVCDVAVAVLFASTASKVDDVTTAVLTSVAPMPAVTVAVMVTVADPRPAIDANVTVRLLPDPPQTPPAVDAQEAKVTPAGSGSVSVTLSAGSGTGCRSSACRSPCCSSSPAPATRSW